MLNVPLVDPVEQKWRSIALPHDVVRELIHCELAFSPAVAQCLDDHVEADLLRKLK